MVSCGELIRGSALVPQYWILIDRLPEQRRVKFAHQIVDVSN